MSANFHGGRAIDSMLNRYFMAILKEIIKTLSKNTDNTQNLFNFINFKTAEDRSVLIKSFSILS